MIGRGVSPINCAPLLNIIFKKYLAAFVIYVFLFLTENNPSFTLFLICFYFFAQSELRCSYKVCSDKKKACMPQNGIFNIAVDPVFSKSFKNSDILENSCYIFLLVLELQTLKFQKIPEKSW